MPKAPTAYRRILDIDSDAPPPELGITAQQWRFARAYADDPDSLVDAARKAGYSGRSIYATASTLIRSPKIQAAIAAIRADMEQSSRLSANFVRGRVAWAMSLTPGSEDGPGWREWVALAGLAARIVGLIQPGEHHSTTLQVSARLEALSTDELLRIVQGDPAPDAIPANCAPVADDG